MNPEYELWRAQGYCQSLRPLHWPGHVDPWLADIEPLAVTDLPPELEQWRAEFDRCVLGLVNDEPTPVGTPHTDSHPVSAAESLPI